MSLWLAVARSAPGDACLQPHLTEALECHRRLANGLEAVDGEHLAALRGLVAALERDLRRAATVLGDLRALKSALDAPEDPR